MAPLTREFVDACPAEGEFRVREPMASVAGELL